MNEYEYNALRHFRPSVVQHLSYWFFFIIYIALICIAPIFALIYHNKIIEYIFQNDNDLVFSVHANGVFSLSSVFIFLPVLYYIIFIPVKKFKIMEKTVKWYEAGINKNEVFSAFQKKQKMYNIITFFVVTIASLFAIFSIFYHLRVNTSGIYYTNFFRFSEKKYEWSTIKGINVFPVLDKGKHGTFNLAPKMQIYFDNNILYIWQGAGLASPNADKLVEFLKLATQHSNAKIKVDNFFNDKMIHELKNLNSNEKSKNIIEVFKYLGYNIIHE